MSRLVLGIRIFIKCFLEKSIMHPHILKVLVYFPKYLFQLIRRTKSLGSNC